MINQREERGKIIAQTRAITKVNNGYLVSSQTSNKKYLVSEHLDNCNCPDCQLRQVRCKHAFAVEYYLQKATTQNGETKIETKRLTYPQAWSVYNKSQEDMCFVVAKAMKETISIDSDVGGKVRMAIIAKTGVRILPDNVVGEYLEGPEEHEKHKIERESEGLKKLIKE